MKRRVTPSAYIHPMPVAVIASCEGDALDFTTISNVGVVGVAPPVIMISIHADNFISGQIDSVGQFTVNIPTPELLDEVDACGIASALSVDKSSVFKWHVEDGYVCIDDMPITLKCHVVEQLEVGYRKVYLAEVKESLVDEALIVDHDGENKAEFLNFVTIGYGLDCFYYALGGEHIGEGHNEGAEIVKTLPDKSEFKVL